MSQSNVAQDVQQLRQQSSDLNLQTVPLNSFQIKVEVWEVKIQTARQNLAVLDETIAGRTRYQKEQEVLIADQAESGNTMLRGLDYEITEATQVLKDLKVAKRLLIQDKQQLETDLEQARADFQIEVDKHLARLQTIEAQITAKTSDNIKNTVQSTYQAN